MYVLCKWEPCDQCTINIIYVGSFISCIEYIHSYFKALRFANINKVNTEISMREIIWTFHPDQQDEHCDMLQIVQMYLIYSKSDCLADVDQAHLAQFPPPDHVWGYLPSQTEGSPQEPGYHCPMTQQLFGFLHPSLLLVTHTLLNRHTRAMGPNVNSFITNTLNENHTAYNVTLPSTASRNLWSDVYTWS